MVPADSQQIPRARCYWEHHHNRDHVFAYGLSPSTADHPRPLRLTRSFFTVARTGGSEKMNPTTPHTQPRRVSHMHGLAILRVRSPLLTESQLFSLPTGTEMFHFPAFPPTPMYSAPGDTTSLVLGSPFGHPRITARLTAPSRLIAASHVLHRLPVPRHPPCALKHLQHKKPKRNCTSTTKRTHPPNHVSS